jgi:hypothetical protein
MHNAVLWMRDSNASPQPVNVIRLIKNLFEFSKHLNFLTTSLPVPVLYSEGLHSYIQVLDIQ